MKRFFFAIIAVVLVTSLNAQQKGTFKDTRDSKTYKTITIGTQTWMAENLAYMQKDGVCLNYNNHPDMVKYGYLYGWETALNVCPAGWHLPSDAEWAQLTNFVGSDAGIKLKTKNGWRRGWNDGPVTYDFGSSALELDEYGNGTDDFGFSALPGGGHLSICNCYDGVFSSSAWWTSSTNEEGSPIICSVSDEKSEVKTRSTDASNEFSVRCLKD